MSFDAREELLAVGFADGSVKIWDLIQRKLARTFSAHTTSVTSVAFHPHAQFLYVLTALPSRQCSVHLPRAQISLIVAAVPPLARTES